MAKRLTDTDKWKREWFYDLKPHAKLAWLYLLDQCDHCGIWPRNFRLMSEQLGLKVDHQTLVDWFGEKIIHFDEDKYFIPSFFEFQYGHSKEGFKAKVSAQKQLEKLGLFKDGVLNTKEHLPNSSEQSMDCPSISKSISKSISNKGGVGEKITDTDLDPIYALYPRKVGKTRGYALAKKLSREELDDLRRAVSNYRSATEKTESRFIKHFSTFMGEWRDWLEWQPDAPESPPSIADVKARVEAYRRSLEAL